MTEKTPPIPGLRDLDLRLLRVFAAIVRHRGFAAAQDELGISASTISIHIRQLEHRLRVRLCDRGRKGFRLTEQGQIIYDATLKLFRSLEEFRGSAGSVRGRLVGDLHLGLVDAVATNTSLRLGHTISEFSNVAPEVRINIDINSPQVLHQGLLEERYHVILSPMLRHHDAIKFEYSFDETQLLYCGKRHRLFSLPDKNMTRNIVADSMFVGRSYTLESKPPKTIDFDQRATAAHMESIALMILSGKYIGYLPDHYARQWETTGEMRSILPQVYRYNDEIYLGHRVHESNRVAIAFIEIARGTILNCK